MKLRDNKGRGAISHVANRFEKQQRVQEHPEGVDEWEEMEASERTKFIEVHPKSILNKIDSPDVPGSWGMNPYQGCEHGCSYCYARNSHEYWGYNAGPDFERIVLYKRHAAELLGKALRQKKWKGETIMLSGNTDCYQPAEKKLKITRALLEVCREYKQSLNIVTKNALILRDLDILEEMAADQLVNVAISINGLDEKVRSKLEPRTSTYGKRLKAIEKLNEKGVPVRALIAPVIPGLTDHHILPLAEACAKAGAMDIGYVFIRLNGHLSALFSEWLEEHFPDRKEKVLSLIKQGHAGKLNDNVFGRRMRGDGPIAETVRQQVEMAKSKFFSNKKLPKLDTKAFRRPESGQMRLF